MSRPIANALLLLLALVALCLASGVVKVALELERQSPREAVLYHPRLELAQALPW